MKPLPKLIYFSPNPSTPHSLRHDLWQVSSSISQAGINTWEPIISHVAPSVSRWNFHPFPLCCRYSGHVQGCHPCWGGSSPFFFTKCVTEKLASHTPRTHTCLPRILRGKSINTEKRLGRLWCCCQFDWVRRYSNWQPGDGSAVSRGLVEDFTALIAVLKMCETVTTWFTASLQRRRRRSL